MLKLLLLFKYNSIVDILYALRKTVSINAIVLIILNDANA